MERQEYVKLPAPLLMPALAFAGGCAPCIPLVSWTGIVLSSVMLLGVWLWTRHDGLRLAAFYGLLFFMAQGYRLADQWEPRESALVNLGDERFDVETEWVVRLISEMKTSKEAYQRRDETERATYSAFAEAIAWRVKGESADRPALGRVFIRIRNAPHGFYGYGDVLRVRGGLSEPEVSLGPGKMDWRAYLQSKRVSYDLRVDASEVEILDRQDGKPWVALAYRIRAWASETMELGLEDDPLATAVLSGQLFGYTDGIPEYVDEWFRITGTYHIFAISGQNVGIILGMGLVVLLAFGLNVYRVGWVLMPVLVMYAFVSDLQPSVVRAVTMVGGILLIWMCERPVSWLNLWACALLGLLLVEPRYLSSPAFVLSFSVVLGLVVLSPPIMRWLIRPFEPDRFLPEAMWGRWRAMRYAVVKFVMGFVALSVAAWCGSVVWMLVYFQYLSVVSLLANMVVVPTSSMVVAVGMASLLFAPWWAWVTISLNNFNWLLVQVMLTTVSALGQVPWAAVYVSHPSEWGRIRDPVWTLVNGGRTVTALVRHEGGAWLLNPGSERNVPHQLKPLIRYYGVWRLDQVLITQMANSVAGGSSFLLEHARVREWVLPPRLSRSRGLKEWLKPLSRLDVVQRHVWAGEVMKMGEKLRCRVLWPPEEYMANYLQDQGLVLLFEYGGSSLLWAGQINTEIEEKLMRQYPSLKVDVLIQGHHPQNPSLSKAWLDKLKPKHFIYWEGDPFFPRKVPWFFDEDNDEMKRWTLNNEAIVIRMQGEGIDVVNWRDRNVLLRDRVDKR